MLRPKGNIMVLYRSWVSAWSLRATRDPSASPRYLQVDLHVGVVTNAQVQSSPLAGPEISRPCMQNR